MHSPIDIFGNSISLYLVKLGYEFLINIILELNLSYNKKTIGHIMAKNRKVFTKKILSLGDLIDNSGNRIGDYMLQKGHYFNELDRR